MPKTLNAINSYQPSIPNFPIAGNNEPLAIGPLEAAIQALLNNSLNAYTRLGSLEAGVKRTVRYSSLSALSAVSGFVDGDTVIVDGYGAYTFYNPSALAVDGLWILSSSISANACWVHIGYLIKGSNNGLATLTSGGRLSQDVRDGSILTQHIGNAQVTDTKVADGSISNAKLAGGSVAALLGYTPANKAGDVFGGNIFAGGLGINRATLTAGYLLDVSGGFKLQAGGNIYGAGGAIDLYATTAATAPMARISGSLIASLGSEEQGEIAFWTRPNGAAGQSLLERLRIRADGSLSLNGRGQIGEAFTGGANYTTWYIGNSYWDGSNWITPNLGSSFQAQVVARNGTLLFITDANGGPSVRTDNDTTFINRAKLQLDPSGKLTWTDGSAVQGDLSVQAVPNANGVGSTNSPTIHSNFGLVGINNPVGVNGSIWPYADNASQNLGSSARRWSLVFAATGTIQTSDRNAKTDIRDTPLGLEFIRALRPVAYRWKVGKNEPYEEPVEVEFDQTQADGTVVKAKKTVLETRYRPLPGKRLHYGLIAQEVKAVLDQLAVEDFGGWVQDDMSNPNSPQSLRYDQFIAPLIRALQELDGRISLLEAPVKKAS